MRTGSLSLGDPKHEAYLHRGVQPSTWQQDFGLSVSLRLPNNPPGQGQGLKQRCLSSPGAATDPAPSRSSEPLGLAKFVSPCLCPTTPLPLPLLIYFSPSLGLQPPLPLPIPAVTQGTTLALGQSREPDLLPRPALGPPSLGDGCTISRLSVALAWRKALGFHLPDRQLRLQRRSNLTEAESL